MKVDVRIFQTRDMGAESSVSFSPTSLHPQAFSIAADTLLVNQEEDGMAERARFKTRGKLPVFS